MDIHTFSGFGAKSFRQTCAMMPAASASPRTLVIVLSRSLEEKRAVRASSFGERAGGDQYWED